MTIADDWTREPPYAHPRDAFVATHRAQCYCGAIAFEVRADPVDAKICHCRVCQLLHGAPFQWAVIFRKNDVRFVHGVDKIFFFNAEIGRPGRVLPCKLSCNECRSPIADEGRRMFLAFGPLFDFRSRAHIPPLFEPTCHIFYGTPGDRHRRRKTEVSRPQGSIAGLGGRVDRVRRVY